MKQNETDSRTINVPVVSDLIRMFHDEQQNLITVKVELNRFNNS